MINFFIFCALTLSSFAFAEVNVFIEKRAGLSEADVERMMENFDELYGARVKKKFKKDLKISVQSSDYFGANVDGGYRDNFVNLRMFIPNTKIKLPDVMVVFCHEMGHLVSDGKRVRFGFSKTMAAEGQSDYFATFCARDYMNAYGATQEMLAETEVDPDVKKVCETNKLKDFTVDHCKIILQGYKSSLRLSGGFNMSYETELDRRVIFTKRGHPEDQCRIDTVKNAVLGKGRDRCWYNPILL